MHMSVRALLHWNFPNYELQYCPSVEGPTGRASQSHWGQVPPCTNLPTPEYIGHSICQFVVSLRQCNAMLDGIFSGDALVSSFTFNVEHSGCTLYSYLYVHGTESTWMLDHIGP